MSQSREELSGQILQFEFEQLLPEVKRQAEGGTRLVRIACSQIKILIRSCVCDNTLCETRYWPPLQLCTSKISCPVRVVPTFYSLGAHLHADCSSFISFITSISLCSRIHPPYQSCPPSLIPSQLYVSLQYILVSTLDVIILRTHSSSFDLPTPYQRTPFEPWQPT